MSGTLVVQGGALPFGSYILMGKLAALDVANEWYFDSATSTLAIQDNRWK